MSKNITVIPARRRVGNTVNREEALNIIIAYACCTFPSNCDKCPWNGTNDCKSTNFSEVLDEAINVIMEDM